MEIDLSKAKVDLAKPWGHWLVERNACPDGLEYSRGFAGNLTEAAEAWDRAPNPEFLLWVLDRIFGADTSAPRAFMCWCLRHTPCGEGRTVWDLLEDERSRRAVEVAERHVRGEATDRDLLAARHGARAALTAIEEVGDRMAARYAARDTPRVAARATVWNAAELVVWDTVKAASYAAAQGVPEEGWDQAFEKAWDAALQSQVDALRARFGNPFRDYLRYKG
jgi:hypothetical protein